METAAPIGGVALWKDDAVVGERSMTAPLRHSEELLSMLEGLLADRGIERQQIDLVSVNCGPGSFTGLRIGMATAKGICQALRRPLVGVDGTLAYRSRLDPEARVCVLIPSRRDLVYARWFARERPLGETEIRSAADVMRRLVEEERPTTAIGPGAEALRADLEAISCVTLSEEALNRPSAGRIACLGAESCDSDRLYDLEPLYVEPVLVRATGAKR